MGDNGSASTSINIEQLCEQLVKEAPDSMQTDMWSDTYIYLVPVNLRRRNEDAYAPRVISIGPIHHKKEDHAMKTQKRRYFTKFFKRQADDGIRKQFQRELVRTIKDNEVKIRNCYQDEASKLCEDPEEFLKMISWDALFILELFLKTRESRNSQDKNDYIMSKPWLRAAIQRDLILLENQLPFFILEELYSLANKYNIGTDCSSFLKLSCEYFEKYNENKIEIKPDQEPPLHFTDLVRHFLSSEHPTEYIGEPIQKLYRATRLHQAGLKFKRMPNECLINIKAWEGTNETQVRHVAGSTNRGRQGEQHEPLLERKREGIKKGELHVPPLEIDDNTECLLRNLMALEQCRYLEEAYICQYVKFLDFLVDTDEDADLLIESRVIINGLGKSSDVTKLINDLCLEIVEVSSCYDGLAYDLNKYYESTFNRSKAYLRREYFRNVWTGTGTVVGLIVLFINLVQFARSFF